MRMRRTLALCLAAGLCAMLAWLCLSDGMGPKLFADQGTFYYWFPGRERTAGFAESSGPDPLEVFKESLWDKRPDDFGERVIRRLVDSYGMGEERTVDADTSIRSICFCHTGLSITWQDIIAVSRDPVLAADVANAAMDVLYELDLEQEQLRKEQAVSQFAAAYERVRRLDWT